MPGPTIDDYRWLVGSAAQRYLAAGAADAAIKDGSLVTQAMLLRKELSAARTHLILEQLELRRRAKVKFPRAERLFFTRQLLEQATEQRIAAYKASRFAAGDGLFDLCCGIGGDLLALAQRGPCTAVDRDPIAALLAEVNCRNCGLTNVAIEIADVAQLRDRLAGSAWHLDPDRRASGRRASRVEFSEPGLDVILPLARGACGGALKLAPAARLPAELAEAARLEWIGSRGECRQQVAWLGALAADESADRSVLRAATVIDPSGGAHSFSGPADEACPTTQPGRYVYDFDATVVAARLDGALANHFQLSAVGPLPSYLTGDALVSSPLLAVFEVEQVLPMDVKQLKGVLRQRGIGRLEIKTRGAKIHPEQLRPKLQLRGDSAATLLIYRSDHDVRAVLGQRMMAT